MRIHFKGIAHPTALAKSLKRELAAHGHEVGIRTCEQHVAGMTGYANWHELRKVNKGRDVADPTDREAGPDLAEARNRQYVGFLAGVYDRQLASELVEAIRPTGTPGGVLAAQAASAAPAPVVVTDEGYPFAFAHAVVTDRGETLVRSEGRIRIPVSRPGAPPVFSGEFLTSRDSPAPRPLLTRLDIHEVDGALYSRLGPVLNTRVPDGFGRKDELVETLLWRREPAGGVAGHPLVQALAYARHDAPPNLIDHVCPPDWHVHVHEGPGEPFHRHADLYGGMAGLPLLWGASGGMDRHHGDGTREAPTLHGVADLAARGVGIIRDEEDIVRSRIVAAAAGNLAIVGDEVMVRTPEPCWKLSMAKDGGLRLDLYLSGYLRGREAFEPTLFFALDEDEARDRAVESLLRYTRGTQVEKRGRLDALDFTACTIDGNASSMAYLAAGMRDALTQAGKVLPAAAAQAAEALRGRFPVVGYPNLAGFVPRGDEEVTFADGVMDGWLALNRLAGGTIRVDSDVPALARLAGYGVFLMYLASTHYDQAEDSAAA